MGRNLKKLSGHQAATNKIKQLQQNKAHLYKNAALYFVIGVELPPFIALTFRNPQVSGFYLFDLVAKEWVRGVELSYSQQQLVYDYYIVAKLFSYKLFIQNKQFHFIFLEYRIKMQKISRFSTNKNFLPNIYGEVGKNNCRSISYKHHKQNVCTQNRGNKIEKHHESTHRFNHKNMHQKAESKEKEKKILQFQEKNKEEAYTRRKFSRPWIDHQIDFNKQTIKNNQLQPLIHKEVGKDIKNTVETNSILQKVSDETILNLAKTKPILQNKSRGVRAVSQRNDSAAKQKISSCKIAMKKGTFPINKKHYEQLKINQYFQQTISIINKKDYDEAAQQFISFKSFINIIL